MQPIALKKQYEEEGYAIINNVLDDKLMKEVQEHILWLRDHYPDVHPDWLTSDLIDPFWIRLVSDKRLLDIAEQFIGQHIALFGAHYFCKMPFGGKAVLWHQDGSYWPLDPVEVVTLWLAVDDSTPENGCLRVIPRSHTLPLQEMRENKTQSNVLDSEIDPSLVDESKLVNIVLKPGDIEVHHPNIIHGSEANNSAKRRCGLAIRYIPTQSRLTKEDWPSYLLRGEAMPEINKYLPAPKYIAGKHMPFAGCEAWS